MESAVKTSSTKSLATTWTSAAPATTTINDTNKQINKYKSNIIMLITVECFFYKLDNIVWVVWSMWSNYQPKTVLLPSDLTLKISSKEAPNQNKIKGRTVMQYAVFCTPPTKINTIHWIKGLVSNFEFCIFAFSRKNFEHFCLLIGNHLSQNGKILCVPSRLGASLFPVGPLASHNGRCQRLWQEK